MDRSKGRYGADTALEVERKLPIALTESARSVFRELARHGRATRPQIGQALGLSRPTMSAAISELEQLRYVDVAGEVQGPLGRKALEYQVGAGAGHVIAIDAGSTHVQVRVSTLDRRLIHSQDYRLASNQLVLTEEISHAVADQVGHILKLTEPGWGPLRLLGIAVPARVAERVEDSRLTGQNAVFSCFKAPEGVDVLLENNVNCAAVAEQLYGAARGQATFAYVQIGLKIGMGLILSDRLVRGSRGATGEIGHLAFPWGPELTPVPGEIEQYMGADGLLERVRVGWDNGDVPPPASTEALLTFAEAGNDAAMTQVQHHAKDIGALVASIVSIVDPGLVVLGGSVGASGLLPGMVEREANRLSYPVNVRATQLGRDATVLGIERLVTDTAIQKILG